MKIRKSVLLLVLVMFFSVDASAQDYNLGIGLRGGGITSGLDIKVNFDPSNSLHMLLGLAQGACFYGLYERQIPVFERGFHFFYGAGGHLGTWGWSAPNDKFVAGVDAIVGLEYKIAQSPLVFALDYKPCYNFTGKTGFKMADFGFSMRYTF